MALSSACGLPATITGSSVPIPPSRSSPQGRLLVWVLVQEVLNDLDVEQLEHHPRGTADTRVRPLLLHPWGLRDTTPWGMPDPTGFSRRGDTQSPDDQRAGGGESALANGGDSGPTVPLASPDDEGRSCLTPGWIPLRI